jgi:hypothetical protein
MTLDEFKARAKNDLDRAFDAGKAQGGGGDRTQWWTDFVNGCQAEGTWEQAFSGAGINDNTFDLPFSIQPNNAATMFYRTGITDLKGILEKLGITIDFSRSTSANSTFNLSKITRLPKLDFRNATNLANTFANASDLISIDELSVSRAVTNSFTGCGALVEMRIGHDLVASFNISACEKLSAESVESVLSHLGGSATATLTLPSTAQATYDAKYGEGTFLAKVNIAPENWTIGW